VITKELTAIFNCDEFKTLNKNLKLEINKVFDEQVNAASLDGLQQGVYF